MSGEPVGWVLVDNLGVVHGNDDQVIGSVDQAKRFAAQMDARRPDYGPHRCCAVVPVVGVDRNDRVPGV